MSAADVAQLVAGLLAGVNESPFLCEDCDKPTDLGRKCRACYATWSRMLWQDCEPAHRALLAAVRRLREHPQKHGIAVNALGRTGEALSNDAADLLAEVRAALVGPFSQTMRGVLDGLATRSER